MVRKNVLVYGSALLLLALLCASPVAAEERLKRITGLVGFGGSPDGDPEDGIDHASFQAGFSFEVDSDVLVGFRAGKVAIDGDGFGARKKPDLTYVTAAGEYLFSEGYYRSGLYVGLGLYRLDDGGSGLGDESSPGLSLGLTGDFEINDRLAFVVELSGHYADLGGANFFAMLHAGVGYRF